MPPITFRTVLKLLFASLVVGALMAWFGVTPEEVLRRGAALVGDAFRNARALFGDALSYILLGAVIVVPIWLISYLLKALKGRP
ncbi:MAG TPA: DUF6460 domain-containing protein [Geminicoccaceae bacterium]|nr:DUF6460 domain-containing protein [Geminicoccaceae bacterium]